MRDATSCPDHASFHDVHTMVSMNHHDHHYLTMACVAIKIGMRYLRCNQIVIYFLDLPENSSKCAVSRSFETN